MGQLTKDCPHCHTKSVSFSSYSEVIRPNTKIHITAFYCGSCYGGYIAEIECHVNPSAHGLKAAIENNPNYVIKKEYPLPKITSPPKYLPGNINSFFLQASNSLRDGNLDASSMMSRKVLEVAVKTLEPKGTGNLYQRIESLEKAGKVTKELKEWAHIIRDDGNDATHEESPVSIEFTKELLSFTEIFLMYTFTMPGMLADRRPKQSKPTS